MVVRDLKENKRAQRALGRSPEEKVKGHSGAIYRGPLMLQQKCHGWMDRQTDNNIIQYFEHIKTMFCCYSAITNVPLVNQT